MNVVVTIQHPAHVHFFKNAIDELEREGHEVHVFAREKEIAVELLDAYDIDHEVLAGRADSLLSLAGVQLTYELRLLRRARRIDPDVITAIGGVAAAHVATLVGARSVVFYDTEHAKLIQRLAFPFADVICTPNCYTHNLGTKHVRYAGYHELAYLHPDRFTPDEGVLDDLGLDEDDRIAVVRLVDWGASHDVGNAGFDGVEEVVERLEATGAAVLLTSEGPLPEELESYRARIAPERMHDLLFFADLFIGEGATMAAESAVLGTPAVYVNTLSMGYTDELEDRYDLLFNYNGEDRHERALRKGISVLEDENRETWEDRREKLLSEKADTVDIVMREVAAKGGFSVA